MSWAFLLWNPCARIAASPPHVVRADSPPSGRSYSRRNNLMPRPVHFEFTAEDPERAAKFYGDVFGWKIQKWDGPVPYWLIETGKDVPGIDGGMQLRTN